MPEPEIARRCHTCGASIRDRAFFCPQCGSPLEESGADTIPLNSAWFAPEIRNTAESNRQTSADETAPLKVPEGPRHRPGGNAPEYAAQTKIESTPNEVRERGVGQRVEKIRKISTVVLDQAGYDPSLRFLLVAGFLFLIFLVILIMSKFIG